MVIVWYSLGLFYGFVFYAGVKQAWNNLSRLAKVVVIPPLVVFGFADVLFNATIGSMIYLEIPRETTFSARCNNNQQRAGYRGKVAKMFCRLLNSVLPGHCK